MENFPKNTSENKQNSVEKSLIKKGVDSVFELKPELVSVGSKEQYSQYLDTIFSESKIKDILWHGGGEGINTFTTERGIRKSLFGLIKNKEVGAYFTNSIETAKSYQELKSLFKGEQGSKIYPVVVDTKNPYIINSRLDNRTNPLKIRSEFITEKERAVLFQNGYDSVVRDYEYVFFNPDQIHILGSESGVERFKEFIKNKKIL